MLSHFMLRLIIVPLVTLSMSNVGAIEIEGKHGMARIADEFIQPLSLNLVPVQTDQREGNASPPANRPEVAGRVKMDIARMEEIIGLIDKDFKGNNGFWELKLEGVPIQIVTDVNADRMRIMAPILNTKDLSREDLFRLMQANFDSALDARYAIAQGILWGTFMHPLSSLTDQDFLLGIGQTANVVISYGSTFSSGILVFRGGDSGELQQQVIERLRKLSDAI